MIKCKRQIDKTYMISGELDLCIGLGDLWPAAVAGRDSGLLDTLWLDGCLNPGLGAGASYKGKKFLHNQIDAKFMLYVLKLERYSM